MGLWNVYTYIQEYLIAYLFCIFFGLLTGDVFNTYCKKRYTNKFVNINITFIQSNYFPDYLYMNDLFCFLE